ncbi:hypothetical protein SLEP1_g1863 [Rubroshorea leprosula]|uniref:Uncharacterized protein n=1 Tax=Rubroshorea leprosula TaxID=152421 RepID=A0AAV5HPR0_9ROSI|nr:hypothetical protein SLEP1_g1863 [Rubroshorea leprosula]
MKMMMMSGGKDRISIPDQLHLNCRSCFRQFMDYEVDVGEKTGISIPNQVHLNSITCSQQIMNCEVTRVNCILKSFC